MLTDYIVEHAKPGPRAIRLSDARGLYLAVLPNGSKLWRLDFRFDGRRLTRKIHHASKNEAVRVVQHADSV